MERSTIDLWVGIFVVAGLGALTILALKVGNMGSFGGGRDLPVVRANSPISAASSRARR